MTGGCLRVVADKAAHQGRQAVWASFFILRHPANRGKRLRRYCEAVLFQVRGRLLGRPTVVPLGERSRISAQVHDYSATLCVYANPPDYAEMLHWAANLHPGDLFVDVGTNIGTYTIWAAELGATVIAVEPDADARKRLEGNLALNGYQAEIVPLVLADQPGRVSFTRNLRQTNRIATSADKDVYEVEATTLDEVIGDRYVAGVKIDVEGAERLVLEGARRALGERRIGLLQLEWNARSVDLLAEDRGPVAAILHAYGYELFRPGKGGAPAAAISKVDVFARAPRR